MSEKNILQEYCQKNKLPLPEYNSWSQGEPHCLDWFASVTVTINNNISQETITTPERSKVLAERKVASKVLQKLDGPKLTQRSPMINKSSKTSSLFQTISPEIQKNKAPVDLETIKKILLIDLENKPAFKTTYFDDSLYIGFISSTHHSLSKYDDWYFCETGNVGDEIRKSKSNKLIYSAEGGISDLADHYMTMLIYPISDFVKLLINNYSNHRPNIIEVKIISGDHASWCTRACLEKVIEWKKIKNIKVSNSSLI